MSDASADPAASPDDYAELSGRLGHAFREPDLLMLALCHRSWCAENAASSSNERLEFLGDAVLGLAVTDHTFRTYPELPEGSMAKVRAAVVSAVSLADVAGELGLGDHIRLGRGEESTGGRAKPSILADAMEAVLGAVYLDGGWDAALDLVVRLFGDRIAAAAEGPGVADFKTRLQELVARAALPAPDYHITEEGPDHDKRFWASVTVGGAVAGSGQGRSKKQAQQAAAQAAWHRFAATIDAPAESATEGAEVAEGPGRAEGAVVDA